MFDDVGAARLIQELVSQRVDLEMLRTAFGNSLKVGPVEVIDAEKGYRLKLGEDDEGEPYLSPWYPHPESGGQTRSWMPLSKGQVVGVLNPIGDQTQGLLLRGGFNGENGPPSEDLAANVLDSFEVNFEVKDGKLTLTGNLHVEGDVVIVGSTDFQDGHVQHNGVNIGDTHVHAGIVPGPADTQGPH